MTEDPESSWWLAKLLGSFLRKGKLNSCTNSGGMLITVHHQAGQGRSESCSSWSQKEGGQGLFSNFFDISFISTRYHIFHENRCWTQRLLSRGWRVLLPLGSVSAFLQPLFRIITYSKQLSPGSKHDRWEPIWEPLRLQQDNSGGVAHHQSPSSMMLMIFFSSPGFQLQCSEAAPHSSNSHQGDIFLHHHHHHVSHLRHHYHHSDEVWSCFTGSPSYFQEKLTLLARFFLP